MTYSNAFALFSAMVVLALIPGPGMMTVISRTLSSGVRHGVFAIFGVLSGDFIYITAAILGLSALSQTMGTYFIIIKYAGAGYLLWLALALWFNKNTIKKVETNKKSHSFTSYLAGLFITIGNPKAIFFYLGFFPAFLDLDRLTTFDIAIILIITTLAIGGIMLGYVLMAVKTKNLAAKENSSHHLINKVASIMIAGSGILLLVKA